MKQKFFSFLLIFACTLITFTSPCQTPEATSALAAEAEVPFQSLASPRDTMKTFLKNMRAQKEGENGRWRIAATAIEMDFVPSLTRETASRQAAFDLHDIFNRIEFIRYEDIPEDPGREFYVSHWVNKIPIMMTRSEDGEWRFSHEVIEAIPDLQNALRDQKIVGGAQKTTFADSPSLWFKNHLPKWIFHRTFILLNFEWFVLFVLISIGFILDRVLRVTLRRGVFRLLRRRNMTVNEEHVISMGKFIGLAVAGIIWLIGIKWMALPEGLVVILWVGALLFTSICGILGLLAFIDTMAAVFQAKAARTESKFDDILIPLIRKSAKVFVIAIGLVFVADNLAVDITSLLAGLGIGGLAFALAAKDTVENVFGSVAILVDRPFQIGDWVVIEGTEGTVEVVGLRSTRIRTFYNSLITVPNSNLIKANVDNYGMRRYRRAKTMINVTYNTSPEKIDQFCEGIRELIRQHPYTRKDNYHIWLNQFNAHSLDILIYMFFEVPDWATELRERHRFFLDIIRLAHRLGVEFAFPTQTLYLERGTGPAVPDETPFKTRREVMKNRSVARDHVKEIVDSLLRDGSEVFPPPPVSFNTPMDPEEMSLRDRGGDAE